MWTGACWEMSLCLNKGVIRMTWAEMWDSQCPTTQSHPLQHRLLISFRFTIPSAKLSFGIVPQSRAQFFQPLVTSVWPCTPSVIERWPLEPQQGLFPLNKSWKSEKHWERDSVCVRERKIDPKLKPCSSLVLAPFPPIKPCLCELISRAWWILMANGVSWWGWIAAQGEITYSRAAFIQELVVMLASTN